ncbi:zinc ribbon domain-containing protein [Funiculus sociatus GB2-A5]|uniref:Zinc ribbon domain-containing protein n=1 Tax=Funiculus sociatus GB2-A5 TaxID=2933946 RepID=A0ABV0JUU5_9CYAN|nr:MULTISPECIES: zinc ribbon domain-containing protein [unclassified Trichocoleus]MBD1906616.1 zinc ribbon domain-containing protein [Trichocoleus sp. FACHB-832]MBD2061519.1 zinc ribbon domain-containing protein [Trichocoleus sp. FACHB-6]
MPLYEFRCESCGVFEEWLKMSETLNPKLCPTCDRISKRVYSAPGLITTPSTLRRRVEQSAEPTIAKRSQATEPSSSKYHNHHDARPWMIGH